MICVTCRDVEFIDRCSRFGGSEHRAYRLPEADLLPEAQIKRAYEIVDGYIRTDTPVVVLTMSPYVIKAIDVRADELECQEKVTYVGVDGHEKPFQGFFRPFSEPFARLIHGAHFAHNAMTGEGDEIPQDGHAV